MFWKKTTPKCAVLIMTVVRFVRTLKNRIYKHITTIVKNVDIVKQNDVPINKTKTKVGDHVRVSK